jgi:hypothetical protein
MTGMAVTTGVNFPIGMLPKAAKATQARVSGA